MDIRTLNHFWDGLRSLPGMSAICADNEWKYSAGGHRAIKAKTRLQGVMYRFVIREENEKNVVGVEIIFESDDSSRNENNFNILKSRMRQVEDSLGHTLIWDFKRDRKRQFVRYILTDSHISDNVNHWSGLHLRMLDSMQKLVHATAPFLHLFEG